MAVIIWTDKFSIGNKAIDQQHQQWINIYNKAHEKMMAPGKKDHLAIGSESLGSMLDYGRTHFRIEEEWMEKIGYAGRESHQALHQEFLKKLERIQTDFDQGQPMLNSELIKLMENWLVDHILNRDKKILAG